MCCVVYPQSMTACWFQRGLGGGGGLGVRGNELPMHDLEMWVGTTVGQMFTLSVSRRCVGSHYIWMPPTLLAVI